MAQIPQLTSTTTLGSTDETILRQGTTDKRISLELAGILSWAKREGYSYQGEYQTGVVYSSAEQFYLFNSKPYFVEDNVSLPYTTTISSPEDDSNLYLKNDDYLLSRTNGINLLANHNFLLSSPDSIIPPSNTPTDYVAGTQIFSGVFVGTDITGLTYINGRVSFLSGDFYLTVSNTGGLEHVTQFTASVADFDGSPRTRGVSYALVGDEYRVTVGVGSLEDVAANLTPLGSVKFEQGSVATSHTVQSNRGQNYSFRNVNEAITYCPSVGSRISCDDYGDGHNSGVLFFKVVEAGTGVADGGRYIDVDATRQLEQNLTTIVNPKQWGAKGGGVVNDATAIANAIAYWRTQVLALRRPKLEFPPDVYLCSGSTWDFTGLGAAGSLVEGNNSIIEFEDLGNSPAIWDWTNSREISVQNIKIRYGGDFDRLPSECPYVGLLWARDSSNAFSGRHRTYNLYVTGTYQLASFYNSGVEENTHYSPEFRNNLEGRRCHVLTCSNHLSATSEYSSITSSAISTTLNTYIRPAFYTDGASREAVSIRGAGGITMVSPYSSCGGTSHYSLQAIDQSCSAIRFIGYQAEQDRGSLGTSAAHVLRFEGDGSLDITGCNFDEQFSTTTDSEVIIDSVRNFKRVTIATGGEVRATLPTTALTGCDLSAGVGVNINNITSVSSSKVYAAARSTINLPTNSKSVTVTTDDLDAPVIVGKVKAQSTSSTVTLDEALIGFSGGGTINNFDSDFSGLPFIAQRLYGYCISASMVIANKGGGTGNIRTETGADMTLTANQYVEITYQGNTDNYYVKFLGG